MYLSKGTDTAMSKKTHGTCVQTKHIKFVHPIASQCNCVELFLVNSSLGQLPPSQTASLPTSICNHLHNHCARRATFLHIVMEMLGTCGPELAICFHPCDEALVQACCNGCLLCNLMPVLVDHLLMVGTISTMKFVVKSMRWANHA